MKAFRVSHLACGMLRGHRWKRSAPKGQCVITRRRCSRCGKQQARTSECLPWVTV